MTAKKSTTPKRGLASTFRQVGRDVRRLLKDAQQGAPDGHAPANGGPDLDYQPAGRTGIRVLVTGATGFIGPMLVEELLAAGYDVVCAIRSPERAKRDLPYPGITFIQADMNTDTDPAVWKQRLKENGIDTVVNNAGLEAGGPGQNIDNINFKSAVAIAQACAALQKETGEKKRFLQISTGLLTADHSEGFDYTRTKQAVEDALHGMKDLDWVCVRPNYVYEPGKGHVLFEEVVKLPALPFVKDGPKQPISSRDLAIGVAKLATPGDRASHTVLEAAGRQSLTWRGMLENVGAALEETNKLTPCIPRTMALSAAAVGHALPQGLREMIAPYIRVNAATLEHISPTILKMICSETRSDPQSWIEQAGVTPSNIHDVYKAWSDGPAAYAALYANKRNPPALPKKDAPKPKR